MQPIRSILVVLNPASLEQPALTRAKLIAGVTESHLHLLLCSKQDEPDHMLKQLCQNLNDEGYNISWQTAWYNSLHETICHVQQEQHSDLVVKHHIPDNPLKKALLTPEDWRLLRACEAPVLLVKHERPWTGGKILAAVDVGNDEPQHMKLHQGIIDRAFEITALAQGQLHIVSAHPSPMLAAANPTFQLSETIESSYRQRCHELLSKHSIEAEQIHIEEGPADVLIPFVAQKINAVATIIGSVARRGLSAALIGNTAEVILDSLENDVLVLKPDQVQE